MKAAFSRAIRLTSSGVAIDRPTVVVSFSVKPNKSDVIARLRDGGATGPIMWDAEADSASGSSNQTFNPGIRFYKNVYIEIIPDVAGGDPSVCIAVLEP
jgi:hypothetical protein